MARTHHLRDRRAAASLKCLALALFVTACTPYKMPPTADFYHRTAPWTACADADPPHLTWTSEYGLRFYVADGAKCPDTSEMEETARHALARLGAEQGDIWGARIIFVPTRIWCDGSEVFGCTFVSERGADVLLTDRPGAWSTLRHELGHVVRFRRRGDGDRPHKDCAWWERLEGRDCGIWK